MFSCGVIIFSLLSGCWPFPGKNKKEVLRKNKGGICIFRGKYWNSFSNASRNFVKKLLIKDPKKRMTAK